MLFLYHSYQHSFQFVLSNIKWVELKKWSILLNFHTPFRWTFHWLANKILIVRSVSCLCLSNLPPSNADYNQIRIVLMSKMPEKMFLRRVDNKRGRLVSENKSGWIFKRRVRPLTFCRSINQAKGRIGARKSRFISLSVQRNWSRRSFKVQSCVTCPDCLSFRAKAC